jgi:hypothetical protein
VQALTPSQGWTGWGAFQRRSPTGGAANGIPLKMLIRPLESVLPEIRPPSTAIEPTDRKVEFSGLEQEEMRKPTQAMSKKELLDIIQEVLNL